MNLSKTEPEKAILVRNQKMYLYIKKVAETEEAGGNRPPIEGVKFVYGKAVQMQIRREEHTQQTKNGLIKLEGLITCHILYTGDSSTCRICFR